MNKLVTALFLTCMIFSCDIRNMKNKADVQVANPSTKFTDSTTVQMIDSTYNFGKVTDGEKVEYNFKFRNTGKNPLIISSATASCGCTVPEKPQQAFAPGQEGTIKAKFDSKGKPVGEARKEIYVTANVTPSTMQALTFRVEITN